MKTTGQKRAWNRAYYYRHRERLLLDMKERHQRCHHIWEARYKKNKEVIAQKARAYRLANIEKFREYDRLRHIRNRDARSAYNKKRRSANVAQRRARDRELYRANAEAICAKKRASGKTPEGRIKIMMRNTVKRITLKGGAAVAKSIYYLGCSIEHARAHIERQFELGMTWENHGVLTWHIDHIRPLASFDLSKQEDVARATHYTNLRPVWASENLSKGAKLIAA